MATYTPNLNLYKPDDSDNYEDFREGFNDNMDILDQGGGGGTGDVIDVEVDGVSVVDEDGVAKIIMPTVPSELNDLSDVNINNPSSNQILRYNSGSGEWVNIDENVYIIDDTTASLMTYDSDYIEINLHNFVLRQSWEVESVTQAIDRGYCVKVTPFITDITVSDVVIV